MANVTSSIVYVLHQEDARMLGKVTNASCDRGGRTRFGIAERFHPELVASGFFDETKMAYAPALAMAEDVYAKQYCTPMQLPSIEVQQVSNALLSFAVNEGTQTSIEVAQKALGVDSDGSFGPNTLKAVNSTAAFLTKLYAAQIAHYEAIVVHDPSQARFLDGWKNRVKEDCAC